MGSYEKLTSAKACCHFLTPSARSANLIAGDGTKNGLSRSEQKTVSTTQNNRLTGKAPYKFESISLQRGVNCKPDFRGASHPSIKGHSAANSAARTGSRTLSERSRPDVRANRAPSSRRRRSAEPVRRDRARRGGGNFRTTRARS